MAAGVSFSGLASGIDFQSMADQIIEIESRPIQRVEEKIQEAETRQSAWETFRTGVISLEKAVEGLADGSVFDQFGTSVTSLSPLGIQPVAASAGAGAVPGSYQVKVLQLATNEKLGSDSFSSRTEALGLSGEFILNGSAVRVEADDTLNDIVDSINAANRGTDATGVSAAILTQGTGSYSVILTSNESGAEGVSLLDGADGLLQSLGFVDSTLSIRNQTSDGARGDWISNATGTVASTLGLASPPAADTVTVGGFSVALDLSSMSLEDVASAINTAASGAGSSVSAQVTSQTGSDGATTYALDIDGTTSFADSSGILETLGVLERGRSAVAQEVSLESALTAGDGTTAANGSTLLSDLWVEGSTAGVQVGDTLDFTGTRGDGSSFTKTFTVGAGDTLSEVLASLNSATDGFQAGSRTATASISDGQLVVTDDQSGSSRLALSVVAHNEGGGTLDFGNMSVSQKGRARELVAGQDAQLEVDGNFLTRSSNQISDAISGVTLSLLDASEYTATVDVILNTEAISEAVKNVVEKYNDLAEWVADQFSGAGATEGVEDRPLSGDGVLRQMRTQLREAMQTQLDESVAGVWARFADVGVEIDKNGNFDFDAAKLKSALSADPAGVKLLFGVSGSGSVSTIKYLTAGSETQSGTYEVAITQAAERGSVTGAGFAGTYVDDGTSDTLTIKDLVTESEFSIALENGMTMTDIVSALNTEFGAETTHQVQATTAMYGDALGTAATDDTLLQDLHDAGGTALGIADGDTLTLSGTRANGTSFVQEFAVTDITTQTLGSLRSAISAAVGDNETVTWEGGLLTVTGQKAGRSSLTLSISSDNLGGGALDFGSVDVVTAGRDPVEIEASDSGGQLMVTHGNYGSDEGFEVSLAAGGTDGSASLGISAGTYNGVDVAGTIGGFSATGNGRTLTGDEGSAVSGLMIRYSGADTGDMGSMTFSRGIASALEVTTESLLGSGYGSIDGVVEGIDPFITRLNDRIDLLEGRLERKRENLYARFARLEEALARAQNQSQWIMAQFSSLSSSSSGSSKS